jgi:hypothetical protein
MTLSSFCLIVQPLALQGLFKRIRKKGSVEIPDLTLIPEIHDEPVFDGYREGGFSPLVRDGGHEKIPMVSSLCRSGGGEESRRFF